MERKTFIKYASAAGAMGFIPSSVNALDIRQEKDLDPGDHRLYWSSLLHKIASPVLNSMSREELKKNMPVETPEDAYDDRAEVTHLEALGRTLAGIAPWRALPETSDEEGQLRKDLQEKVLQSIAHGVDPSSPDYLNFTEGAQPLVDAAFLVHGLLRAPEVLWEPLENQTKQQLIQELKNQRREIKPYYSNWLLFGAMIVPSSLRLMSRPI